MVDYQDGLGCSYGPAAGETELFESSDSQIATAGPGAKRPIAKYPILQLLWSRSAEAKTDFSGE
jgi:hypothetical protein